MKKYTHLERKHAPHLREVDNKKYNQAAIKGKMQHVFLNPQQPKKIPELKNSCCAIQKDYKGYK